MGILKRIGDKVEINIFPKQAEMINSDCDDLLFGGAAGGGKSHALILFALMRRLKHPKSTGILFRRTFPQLEGSLIQKSREIYPEFGAKYQEAKHRWLFPNGSIQRFAHCERDANAYDYHSDEFHDIGFDEASMLTEFQLNYLTSRCRSADPSIKPLVRLASNPGNVSHAYLYERYVKPWYADKIWYDKVTGKKLTFIPARIRDNPALAEADPDYIRRLKQLSEKKYLALAEGRWDVFEGAYFDTWNPEPGHGVLRSPRIPDTYSKKIISLDWGFAEPACALWHEVTPMGRVFTYRELYITRLDPKTLAKEIMDMTPEGEAIEYLSASPEIWGKRTETEGGGEVIQELMQEVFKDRIPMQKANNARIAGWLKVREFMEKAPDGYPWWQVSPVCINLIRTIPCMIHDEVRPEDASKDCEDHAVESLRYALVSLADVPRQVITPYESGYEKIFGKQTKEEDRRYSDIPLPRGIGGY